MSKRKPTADPTPTDPQPDQPPAPSRAERRLQILAELAEIGIAIAQAFGRQTLAEAAGAQTTGDSDPAEPPAMSAGGLAFARVSRAVRDTVALESRLEREHQADLKREQAERDAVLAEQERAENDLGARRFMRRFEVGLVLERSLDAQIHEAVYDEIEARIDYEVGDPEFLFRSTGQSVTRICEDLGLTPDMSWWDDEAQLPRDRVQGFNRPDPNAQADLDDDEDDEDDDLDGPEPSPHRWPAPSRPRGPP